MIDYHICCVIAGSSESEPYSGGRDINDLVSFINSKVGTHRDTDGNLLPEAGRVASVDEIISAAASFDSSFLEKLKSAVDNLDGDNKVKEYGKLYFSLASKVVEKGVAYVSTELARLEKMIKSTSVTPANKTLFQLKRNLLKAFIKLEE